MIPILHQFITLKHGLPDVTNCSLGNLLCCLVGISIKLWDSKLPQAEFAHYHAIYRSSHCSPFQVFYGMFPHVPPDLSFLSDLMHLHGGAETSIEQITEIHEQTEANIKAYVTKYKTTTDAYCHRLVFEVGDLVWALLTHDHVPAHTYNKLKAKKYLFEVLEHINDNNYWLCLPLDITTSDVFNVKYLSLYLPIDTSFDSGTNPSHPIIPDAATS